MSSIVAIHGLGGNWQTTWRAGDLNDSPIWLRDRLPNALSEAGVNARIFSYGHNSNTVNSNSVMSIEDVANSLLGRLFGVRKTKEQKAVPIIFIAHSLGGLVVKKAIILGKENDDRYGELLEMISGCLFLAVPHRGADLAYWKMIPARIIKHLSLSFAGNTQSLRSLERDSEIWRVISHSFVQRGKRLNIRSFYETQRMGNQVVSLLVTALFLCCRYLIHYPLSKSLSNTRAYSRRIPWHMCIHLKAASFTVVKIQ